MANEEQLAILKQGPAEWNEWREKSPGASIDLTRADLTDAYLPYAKFRALLKDLKSADAQPSASA